MKKKFSIGDKIQWNDPDPITGNDYKGEIVKIYEGNTYLINYGEGSEAEVFEHELTLIPKSKKKKL